MSGGAPPGMTDWFAGFAITSISAGGPSPCRNLSTPGPSSWRPSIRTAADVRKSTHIVLTGSSPLQVADPSTSHTGRMPTIGPKSSGKRFCVGLCWHGLGRPVTVVGLIEAKHPAAAREKLSRNQDMFIPCAPGLYCRTRFTWVEGLGPSDSIARPVQADAR